MDEEEEAAGGGRRSSDYALDGDEEDPVGAAGEADEADEAAAENASQQHEEERARGGGRRARALRDLRVWFERGCTPSRRSGVMAAGWAVMWVYVVVGAVIIRAIDESARQSPDAEDAGQGPLSFIDALYFTETWISSCGYGDITPVSDDARAFLSVWSFVGNAPWVVVNGALATLLFDWMLFGLVLYPWWLGRGRDPRRKEDEMSRRELFQWRVLLTAVVVGLVVWFALHLVAAAVLHRLEPDLANSDDPEFFTNSFGEVLYYTIFSSQTTCLGDYTVKTVWGRAFYVVWHQPALVAANLLFTTIALILLKWCNSRLFAIVEKIARKTLSVYSSSSSTSSSLARPRRRWRRRRTTASTSASESAD